jgi:hypothetical protein
MSLPHIGVGSFNRHVSRPAQWLKRYGLFFETFDIVDLEECMHHQRNSGYGKADTIRDCDWPMERGLLHYMSKDGPFDRSAEVLELDQVLQTLTMRGIGLENKWRSYLRPADGFQSVPPEARPVSEAMMAVGYELSALRARRQALVWRKLSHHHGQCPPLGADHEVNGLGWP